MTAITFHRVLADADLAKRIITAAANYEARQAHLAALAAREQRRLDTMRHSQLLHRGRKPSARRRR